MVNVLPLSVVDRGFEPQSIQIKDYEIGICCFSAKHAALRRKSKDWLAQNQDNVSKWGDMFIHRLLFQWASHYKNPIKCVGLVQSGPHHHLIENQLVLLPWYSWKIAELNNNHSTEDLRQQYISHVLSPFSRDMIQFFFGLIHS